MKSLRAFLFRLRALFRRKRLDADMREEMRQHLEMSAAEKIVDGESPADARRVAQRKFGNVGVVQEEARDQRTWVWLDQFFQDLRFATRALSKTPGFTAIIVLTLALGIGANTALFTLMNAIMLRVLPVPQPSALVVARKTPGDASFSYANYRRFRDHVQSVTGLAAMQNYATRRGLVASDFGGRESEPVEAQTVSGNFFAVLGVPAVLGRALTPDDDRADRSPSAIVLSHAFWQRRFGGDPHVLGKTVRLDRATFAIVGVMPPRFSGFYAGVEPDLWWPLGMLPQVQPASEGEPSRLDAGEWLLMVGRLRPEVTREAALVEFRTFFRQQQLATAASQSTIWSERQRRDYLEPTLELDTAATGYSRVRERFAQPVVVLTAAAGLVLLIACANVAGLLLARGAVRQREFAMRIALGAGRSRLIRQLVTESLALAFIGGALGLLLARWGTTILAAYLPPRGGDFDLAPDLRVFFFAAVASALTGIAVGLLPAFRASQMDLATAIKLQSGRTAGAVRSRWNDLLVVGQIALSVALLAGAGLFVRTLRNLQRTDLGFRREQVVVFALESPRDYSAKQRAVLHHQLVQQLEAFPAVRSAAVVKAGLMSGDSLGNEFTIEGYTPALDEEMRAVFLVAGPRFFETLGIPLLRGRDFGPADFGEGPTRTVIIGEGMARRFFPDTDPIGRTIRPGPRTARAPALEVIGIAQDTKYRSVRERTPLEYYLPYSAGRVANLEMSFYVRTPGDPAAFAPQVRAIVRQLDPQLHVSDLRTLADVIDATLVQDRIVAQLAGFFSGFALVLAGLGLYGLLAYSVSQRTREIGVRMALGASVRDVMGLVLGRGLALTLFGCVLGIGTALLLSRFVASLLFGVAPADPLTFVGVTVLFVSVALTACWLPARRATKVDPMMALRAE